jgi:hypothetical protein
VSRAAEKLAVLLSSAAVCNLLDNIADPVLRAALMIARTRLDEILQRGAVH